MLYRVLWNLEFGMKKFVMFMLMLTMTSTCFAQLGPGTPGPGPIAPPVVNPCQQLAMQLNMTIGQLNSWRNILTERRNGLAARQAHLITLQGWLSLFYETVANQGEPMTPGQQTTETMLLMTISNQIMEINQWQAFVNQAQMQVTQWQNAYNQALQAYQAAGC